MTPGSKQGTNREYFLATDPQLANHDQREAELNQLQSYVDDALRQAKSGGATAAEASASTNTGLNVNVRMGEVETLEHTQDRGISVTVYMGQCKGAASSADLRHESIQQCVAKALDIAKFTQEDRYNGLAEAGLMATEFPNLDLWHPWSMDAEKAIERALACEAAGRADSAISNSEGASVSAGSGLSVYGNSHGFIGRKSGTRFSQVCILIAGESDQMQRDFWYDSQRCYGDLESAEETGRKAARRTVERLGARKIPTGHVPVLFAPEMAKGLIAHFVGAVSGGNLYRNTSFLKDAQGQRLFPEWMNIVERPHLPRHPGSAAYDEEGVATKERALIDQGVLTGYVLSSYSGRRLGLPTTGNAGGVHNLQVDSGDGDMSALIQQMGKGLIVTEVMGQGINLVTGDYSRGVSGFWVENGEIQYPVEEVTVAGHLSDMFQSIAAVGSDMDRRSNIQSGSLLIEKMMVAGE